MPRHKTRKRVNRIKKKSAKPALIDKFSIDLVKSAVVSVTGPGSEKIVDLLAGKKNVNEFDISQKLGSTINQTRNVLYKLSDEGLVSFIRKKDKKNGGWYTYFWTLDISRALDHLKDIIQRKIQELNKELANRQSGRIYHCEVCNIEYSEEDALLNSFSCPECGSVMMLRDNQPVISRLNAEIEKAKQNLGSLFVEIDKLQKKEGVVMVRKQKAEERKKKAERKKKREENQKNKPKKKVKNIKKAAKRSSKKKKKKKR